MPVQDLTPQLRTRLSRVERAVGWFVMLATLLLLAGFSYYVYSIAERKGWFLTKVKYYTAVQTAAGLHVGDAVMLMGFDVGRITKIEPNEPLSKWGNIYLEFSVRQPYYGYIWTDSYVKVVSAGLLGSRVVEVVQGGNSIGGTNTGADLKPSYQTDKSGKKILAMWNPKTKDYIAYEPNGKGYGFDIAHETPVVTDRLEELANQAKEALPGILNLTNDLARVLTNAAQLTAHADTLVSAAQPLLTNLTAISAVLTNGKGGLGEWIIPTNLNAQLEQTLTSANSTLISANTNLTAVASSLDVTLINLGNITSNLNLQVQRNDQILSQISGIVTNADSFVQGLKHHWLLRSAFKHSNANSPPSKVNEPAPARASPGETPTPATRPPSAGPKTGKRMPP